MRGKAGVRVVDDAASACPISTKPEAGAHDIVDACALIVPRGGAYDAYVSAPATRTLSASAALRPPRLRNQAERLLGRLAARAYATRSPRRPVRRPRPHRLGRAPCDSGSPASHVGTILPGDDSNSELLIVRGPWPDGLSDGQVAEILEAARPILGHLVSTVVDGQRRARQREQLASWPMCPRPSTKRARRKALHALATALAESSGIEWVTIASYDDSGDAITERALNMARYSETETAAAWRDARRTTIDGRTAARRRSSRATAERRS